LSCNSHTNPHKMRRNYTLGYHLSSIFVCKSGRYCLFYIQSSFQRKRHSRKGFLKCSSSIHWKRIGRIRENKSGSYLGGCRWGSLASIGYRKCSLCYYCWRRSSLSIDCSMTGLNNSSKKA
jgi:hypothetical protein